MLLEQDTITAIATPPGRGGIGIVRVSGLNTKKILKRIIGKIPPPRKATFSAFSAKDKSIIDEGVVLFFPGPNSFTGEDVAEFHGHGGPVVLDYLLQEIIASGARLARPGEFSERAFLNEKLDLAQAEAIADLIDSGSRQAACAAIGSLQGAFSKKVNALLQGLTHLRIYVEAAIDFPEEEIDFLSDRKVDNEIKQLITDIDMVFDAAKQGNILQEGMNVVIVGKPNAGKSSLLNQLSGTEPAIVTEIPGTTRDILRETINIDGMPLHIIDTAGLRDGGDVVEQEGIKRAHQEIEKADHVLLMIDSIETKFENIDWAGYPEIINEKPLTVICNKIDLSQQQAGKTCADKNTLIKLSAKTGAGIDILREHLKNAMGYDANFEGKFLARRRHIDALVRAKDAIITGYEQLQKHKAGELLAEDLRQAQKALSEITGEFTSDDLLGEIFSSFCIGK